jgi:hypothetical protein
MTNVSPKGDGLFFTHGFDVGENEPAGEISNHFFPPVVFGFVSFDVNII